MSDLAEFRKRILDLPPKRVALLALELQEQLEKERAARAEPIAVIGMATRFPGGSNSPDAFWAMLDEGRDAVVEVPSDRWDVDALYDPDPDAAGKVATRWGGYLDDVQRFDSAFFSISPREARAMDPQQRLLLETTWRAFEDAGIPPSRYYGSKAGVFIGICNNDYLLRLLNEGADALDLYLSSGNAYSVAAGRLSFTFGFQGPAVAVDTACSSSLVALHSACQSLLNGESVLAVAGGVNVLCSAETTMALSRSHMMAPDGRCKTFDASADGFVRSEGCGVLLLKRLSDAQRDGDRIHAVIRGTAINQDGRSTGLTVPNGPAQEQVIRDALTRARLAPDDIDYIEAHGTGTTLGDPIEIRALGRVFGKQRAIPLHVGSLKTNVGHLESAAGVAGVIKAILSIQHGRIPPHLHFRTPSRHIEWDDYAIRVSADGTAWPDTGRARRAGVSSFGFSGTNAHVILEQAPEPVVPKAPRAARPAELLVVSGMDAAARTSMKSAYGQALDGLPEGRFADFCHMARVGRTHFGYRSAIVARDRAGALQALTGSDDGVRFDSARRCVEAPGIVFMFTGQGAQHPGMGRALYETAPAFRAAIDRCADILNPLLELPLTQILFEGSGDDAPVYRTSLAQPSVVAFEYSLAEQWRAWGVQPAAVLGHSLGEYVAATVAGVLSLEDMLTLVRERGRLLESLPGGHRMAAVFASPEMLAPILAEHHGAHIAAYNAPENTVLSGPAGVVDRILEACVARGIEHRVLRLEQAFHSPGVEPVMDALQAAAGRVTHHEPRIPIAWNVTGAVGPAPLDAAGYWRNHARQPVRFTQGVSALIQQGYQHFLEVGPHPTLAPLVSQAAEDAIVIPSLRRGGQAWQDIGEAAAQLYVEGVDLDWDAWDDGFHHEHVAIPVHPFAGQRFWVDAANRTAPRAPRGDVPGVRLSSAVPIFETIFTPQQPSFLAEHRYRGRALIPGPLYAELGRQAARAAGLPSDEVTGLQISSPAFIDDAGTRIQTVLEAEDGRTKFRVLSSATDREDWREHAVGWIERAASEPAACVSAPRDGWQAVDIGEHMRRLEALGFELGTAAMLYADLEIRAPHARSRLVAPSGGSTRVLAPLLLDSAIQVLAAVTAADSTAVPRMLTGIQRISYTDALGSATRCEAVLHGPSIGASVVGDVTLYDDRGNLVAHLEGVTLGRVSTPAASNADWFHTVEWRPAARAGAAFTRDEIAESVDRIELDWGRIAADARLDEYIEWLPAVEAQVVRVIRAALEQLGLRTGDTQPDTGTLAHRLGVAPRHHRLLTRLLGIVANADALQSGGMIDETAARTDDVAHATAPASCAPVAALIDRCAAELARVLTGDVDPLHVLFPAGSAELTRAVYQDTPFGRAFNDTLAEVVAALAATHPAEAPLRILEIGAGSGSTAEAVLDRLTDRAVQYTFTDISPTLVSAAEVRLGHREGSEFRTLDIEKDISQQGIDTTGHDIILAANVLHATEDVRRSIEHAASLLRPGGVLILLEGTRAEPWVDITFGLTEGWWRFRDDDLRGGYPLLPFDRWTEVLKQAGFENVASVPADARAHAAGQIVIVAHKAAPVIPAVPEDVVLFDGRPTCNPDALLESMRAVASSADAGRLWIITENAQPVREADVPDPDAAALWGLGRTFALEHPSRWGGLIDLEHGASDDVTRQAVAAAIQSGEDQVAFRSGVRHDARLVKAAPPAAANTIIEPGAYLVTGGLGGLGLKVAHWLAENGATRVVLLGRNASPDAWSPDDPRRVALRVLFDTGVDVVLRAGDVTNAESVRDLFDELRTADVPLRGILHAAAAFDSVPLAELTTERYQRVFAPKVHGALALAEQAAELDLRMFVLFSSTTAVLGVAGLGAYAASNHYLDALAVRLRSQGIPALAVNWGLWDEMRLAADSDAARYEQVGLQRMDSNAALDALGRLIAADAMSAVVADVDWARLRAVYEARAVRPLLAELGHAVQEVNTSEASSRQAATHLETLVAVPDEERSERIVAAITDELCAVLRSTGAVDTERGFFELGMDSLMSVELKTRLEKRFGTRLPATLTFNYPTVMAVAGFLGERVEGMRTDSQGTVVLPPTDGATKDDAAADSDHDGSDLTIAAMLQNRLRDLGLGGTS